MSSESPRTGLLLALLGLLLAACAGGTNRGDESLRIGTTLAPCTATGTVYAALPFDEWSRTYHAGVTAVVDAHLQTMGVVSGAVGGADEESEEGEEGDEEEDDGGLDCSELDEKGIPASAPLKTMAGQLPPWQDPARLAALSATDTAAVLLENLRVFECAMKDTEFFVAVRANRGLRSSQDKVSQTQLLAEQNRMRNIAAQELEVARAALNRTLIITGGFDRMGSFSLGMECLARASLDLRNALGLLTEASACLPRAWDAQGGLRDFGTTPYPTGEAAPE